MTRPAVILFIDHTAEMGGGEISLLNLITHLDRQRYAPHVLLFSDGPLRTKLEAAGVPVRVISLGDEVLKTRKDSLGLSAALNVQKFTGATGHVLKVARAIRQLRPDIVHCNSLKADIIGGLATRLTRRPLIWHVRDRIADDYLPRRVAQLFRRLAARVPHRVVANSSATLGTLVSGDRVPKRYSVILNGTHLPAVVPPCRIGRAGHVPVIGLIGRISQWKGHDVFIRAAAAVRAAGVDCWYRIIGSALFGEQAYESELGALVDELHLTDVIEFAGFRSDIPAEVAGLDLLVHASTVPEPFGQVIIEGMAAGRPVIATRAGGVIEIIDDERTGLLVEPKDVGQLAAAIRRVVSEPSLAEQLGAAARLEVERRFTIDRVARQVEALYDEILRPVSADAKVAAGTS